MQKSKAKDGVVNDYSGAVGSDVHPSTRVSRHTMSRSCCVCPLISLLRCCFFFFLNEPPPPKFSPLPLPAPFRIYTPLSFLRRGGFPPSAAGGASPPAPRR